MQNTHRLTVPAELSSLMPSRDFVVAACRRAGLGAEDELALKLAVDEVLSNLVEHAGLGAGDDIELIVECREGEVRVTVEDQGPPFHPDRAPWVDTAAPAEERSIGGMGWHLVRQMVDEVHYATHTGNGSRDGNRLVLVKRLGGCTGRSNVTKESS